MKLRLLLFGLAVMAFGYAESQIYWNFQTAEPTSNMTEFTADTIIHINNNGVSDTRSTDMSSMGYTGASGGNNLAAAAYMGGFDVDTSTYFEVTINPVGTSSVVISGVSFATQSTSSGPQAFSVRSSANGYATDLAVGTFDNDSTWTAIPVQNFNVVGTPSTPLIFRIYGFNGVGNATPNNNNWRIDDLSFYTSANPLPLTLTVFDATVANNRVNIVWKTEDEKDIDRIVLEKSTDSKEFTSFNSYGSKDGKANTYTAVDEMTSASQYYRLKITDINGESSYSKVLKVNGVLSNTTAVSLYPNPAQTSMYVEYPLAAQKTPYVIFTTTGIKVFESSFAPNTTRSLVDVSTLPMGNYVLYINDGVSKDGVIFVRN